jgi:hypothetical protein
VDEGLVVEADRKQEVQVVEHGQRVVLDRRPRVLRLDPLPPAKRLRARPNVRNSVDVNEAIWTMSTAA